jgi:hypothetical protein
MKVQLDEGALRALLDAEDGPVARELSRRLIDGQAIATELCPVDTGNLRSSITHVVTRDEDGLVGYLGSGVEYALDVELGTYKMEAQPYLRPALDEIVRSNE